MEEHKFIVYMVAFANGPQIGYNVHMQKSHRTSTTSSCMKIYLYYMKHFQNSQEKCKGFNMRYKFFI